MQTLKTQQGLVGVGYDHDSGMYGLVAQPWFHTDGTTNLLSIFTNEDIMQYCMDEGIFNNVSLVKLQIELLFSLIKIQIELLFELTKFCLFYFD